MMDSLRLTLYHIIASSCYFSDKAKHKKVLRKAFS